MKQEIIKKENNELIEQNNVVENVYFSANDLVFPKIWLLQPMSQAVLDGVAKLGDFWSTTEEKVMSKELKIIPIIYKKICFVTEKPAGKNEKFKLVEIIEVKSAEQERLPWNEIVDGKEIKREYAFVFFVLVDGYNMPMMLTLKGTSYNVGKKIATQMYVINKMKKCTYYPSATSFLLTSKIEKNDEGTYAVFYARPNDITSEDTQKECLNWQSILSNYSISYQNENEIDDKNKF